MDVSHHSPKVLGAAYSQKQIVRADLQQWSLQTPRTWQLKEKTILLTFLNMIQHRRTPSVETNTQSLSAKL